MILVTVGVLVLLTVTGKTGGTIVTVPLTRSPAPRALLPATVYVVVVPVGATRQAGPPALGRRVHGPDNARDLGNPQHDL